MKHLWKEPFVHFVLLGALLFATQLFWSPPAPDSREIVISETAQQRLFGLWTIEALRSPTAADKKDIIADYVREEALVREAEALGLAEGDTVVRRRMAQKMRELLEDRVSLIDPNDQELRAWFARNQAQFATPERRTFQHIYFSGQTPEANAAKIAAAQAALKSGQNWQSLGDAFIEKRVYSDINMGEAARIFGRGFAESLFAQPQGQWSEPIPSAFGRHLVRIAAVSEGAAADFDERRSEIVQVWQEDQRRTANQGAVDALVARYSVTIK